MVTQFLEKYYLKKRYLLVANWTLFILNLHLLFLLTSGLAKNILPIPPFFIKHLWLITGFSFCFLIILFSIIKFRKKTDLEKAAVSFEKNEKFFNLDIISAVQFQANPKIFSKFLVNVFQEEVFEKLKIIKPEFAIQKFKLKKNFLISLLFVNFFLFSNFYDKFGSTQNIKPQESLFLILKDINIHLYPPAYTGKSELFLRNSSGDFSAVKGTKAEINFKTDNIFVELILSFKNSNYSCKLTPEGSYLTAFTVTESGSYRFLNRDKEGTFSEFSNIYQINVIDDRTPFVEILKVKEKLVVKEDEKITFDFFASDDFGISKLLFQVEKNSQNFFQEIISAEKNSLSIKNSHLFELPTRDLKPGDLLDLYILAYDNDTITGPKETKSNVLQLEIFNPKKRHSENVTALNEVVDKLVGLLADLLVNHSDNKKISDGKSYVKQQKELLTLEKRFNEYFQVFFGELLQDKLFIEATLADLKDLNEEFSQLAIKKETLLNETKFFNLIELNKFLRFEIRRFESSIIKLESLIKIEKLYEMKGKSEELSSLRKELQELLKKYKESPSPELLAEIKKKIRRVKDLMNEINQNLAHLSRDIAEEFFNKEALKALSEEDPEKLLDASGENKMDDTLSAIEGFLENLSTFIDSVANPISGIEQNNFSADTALFEGLEKEMQALINQQGELYKNVSNIGEEGENGKLREKLKEKLKSLSEKIFYESVELQRKGIKTESSLLENQFRNLFSSSRFLKEEMYAERLREVQNYSENIKKILARISDIFETEAEIRKKGKLLLELKNKLNSISVANSELLSLLAKIPDEGKLTEKERKKMERMAEYQEELLKRQASFSENLDKTFGEKELLKNDFTQYSENIQNSMKESANSLKNHDKPASMLAEESALKDLKKLKGALSGMKEKLSKKQFSKKMQNSRSTKEIKIPQKEEDKGSENLNQQIIEALKEEYPPEYEKQIKNYYNSLLK